MNATEYEINTVQDFLKVPEDRLHECIMEFRQYLNSCRCILELLRLAADKEGKNLDEFKVDFGPFFWCDDCRQRGTIEIIEEREVGNENR